MSETRTCSECGITAWVSEPGAPTRVTVETVVEGVVVDAEDRVLCSRCRPDRPL